MTTHDLHHLAAAYALDALDAAERASFEAHYPSCEVCNADVRSFRATLAEVAAAEAVSPPPALKARVMAEVADTRQLSPLLPEGVAQLDRRRAASFIRLVTAAAAALVLIGVAAFVVGRSSAPDDAGVASALEEVLAEPDARTVVLTPADGVSGSVRVSWSETDGRAVVIAEGLAPAADGRAYELWSIDERGPTPMSMLDQAGDGSIRSVVDLDGEPALWGVTIEPAEGSDTPTEPILHQAAV